MAANKGEVAALAQHLLPSLMQTVKLPGIDIFPGQVDEKEFKRQTTASMTMAVANSFTLAALFLNTRNEWISPAMRMPEEEDQQPITPVSAFDAKPVGTI